MKLPSAAIRFVSVVERAARSKEHPPEPGPEPIPPPAPEHAPLAPEPTPPAPEREWNVWELERLARDGEARDEEVAFLLRELRQFANADGRLPVSFDPVIRESFGQLLYAG